jgi:hypothetical protein
VVPEVNSVVSFFFSKKEKKKSSLVLFSLPRRVTMILAFNSTCNKETENYLEVTMNLISRIYHLCEREVIHLFVVRNY